MGWQVLYILWVLSLVKVILSLITILTFSTLRLSVVLSVRVFMKDSVRSRGGVVHAWSSRAQIFVESILLYFSYQFHFSPS